MVPCYATSIEGVGALVLSPDESKVLLVWEYGQWKPVTGAVDAGESKITSLARELGEEVGSELDLSFAPRYLGGWQISKARDKLTNDNFSSFVVRAKTADFAVDGKEIVAAKWFDRTELMAAFKAAGSPQPMGTITLEDPERELGERTKVSTNALNWLANYESGASLLVRLQSRNGFQQIMNIGGTAPPVKA
jgi:8-oxo-dGTP pyrophosphatase MutT (NUDIX family)